MNLKKFSSYAVVLTAMAALLGACSGGTVYDQYDHTPLSGWEKNDTLSFDIPPMKHTALYREELGLRINGAFPFKSLQLIVEQKFLASKKIRRDTLPPHRQRRKRERPWRELLPVPIPYRRHGD